MNVLEHPDITRVQRFGHLWLDPEEEEFDQDRYEAYCDRCFEEQKEERLFGSNFA